MPEVQTVVACVDHADVAIDILGCSRTIASLYPACRAFVAHAVPEVPPALAEVLFPYVCLGDDLDAIAAELVRASSARLARRLKDHLPGPAAEVVRGAYGPVANAIDEVIGRTGPDLIVIGAVGDGNAPALGSVAARLVARSAVPVMVVRPSLPRWEPKTIVVGVDGTPSSGAVLEHAIDLAHRARARVVPVTAIPTIEAYDRAGLWAPKQDVPGRVRKEVVRLLNQVRGGLQLPFPIVSTIAESLDKPRIDEGEPAAVIAHAAEALQADLVIVGTRSDASGSALHLGRVAERVLRTATCHVLLVPPVVAGEAT